MENGKKTKGRLDPRMARALDLHNEGISTIPVDLSSKRAVVKFKQYQECVIPSHILAAWWGAKGSFLAPKYGIAMLTDRRMVIDVDSYKANTPQDLNKGLEASHTYSVSTPRGGTHYYFAGDPEFSTLKQPEHGFDIRARGGYVLIPPSKGYKVRDAGPVKVMPLDVKDMLTRLCGNGDKRNPDGWYERALTDVTPRDSERGIHTLAPKMIGKWIGEGVDKEEMLQRLAGWCVVNKLDVPVKELARIIESVHETHKHNHPDGGTASEFWDWLDVELGLGEQFNYRFLRDRFSGISPNHLYFLTHKAKEKGMIKGSRFAGTFVKIPQVRPLDWDALVKVHDSANVKTPLELERKLKLTTHQLVVIAGATDAGKSAFLWDLIARNCHEKKIVFFYSSEWSEGMIRERTDALRIPRDHRKNILVYPMVPEYLELIPDDADIIAADYIRAGEDAPVIDIDKRLNEVLDKLGDRIAFCALQKHPQLDRPVGGQFGCHAAHHVIFLDWLAEESKFELKVFKTKGPKILTGVARNFTITHNHMLEPLGEWYRAEFKFNKD